MDAERPVKSIQDIPGWFPWLDQAVFEHFLSADAVVPRGDLVELGVYLGKSAALMGRFKRDDETFTVCDLFGAAPGDEANKKENEHYYGGLERAKFERNYLALFAELPVVVQDYSSTILNHVKPASARFVHVDASHLYEHVAADVESARIMLKPDGVVAFDDFRSAHTPGVSAAVWEAVCNKGLRPICVTLQKLYGTFGDPEPHRQRMTSWLQTSGRYGWETESIAGVSVIRLWPKGKSKAPDDLIAELTKRVGAVERRNATMQQDVAKMQTNIAKMQTNITKLRTNVKRLSDSRLTYRIVRRLKALSAGRF